MTHCAQRTGHRALKQLSMPGGYSQSNIKAVSTAKLLKRYNMTTVGLKKHSSWGKSDLQEAPRSKSTYTSAFLKLLLQNL